MFGTMALFLSSPGKITACPLKGKHSCDEQAGTQLFLLFTRKKGTVQRERVHMKRK
jgi:hypothetical protein